MRSSSSLLGSGDQGGNWEVEIFFRGGFIVVNTSPLVHSNSATTLYWLWSLYNTKNTRYRSACLIFRSQPVIQPQVVVDQIGQSLVNFLGHHLFILPLCNSAPAVELWDAFIFKLRGQREIQKASPELNLHGTLRSKWEIIFRLWLKFSFH